MARGERGPQCRLRASGPLCSALCQRRTTGERRWPSSDPEGAWNLVGESEFPSRGQDKMGIMWRGCSIWPRGEACGHQGRLLGGGGGLAGPWMVGSIWRERGHCRRRGGLCKRCRDGQELGLNGMTVLTLLQGSFRMAPDVALTVPVAAEVCPPEKRVMKQGSQPLFIRRASNARQSSS